METAVASWWSDGFAPLITHVLFDRTGWLPHHTTPFELIGDGITDSELTDLLQRHYRENWPTIDVAFRRRLERLQVDDQAKAAFGEALEAHGAGLYRLVVCSVFPEIERVARAELLDGSLRPISSLTDVRRAAEERLALSDLQAEGGGPVFAQFGRMSRHLYDHVRTPEDVLRVAADPVPNRHAAIHGLVTYERLQNSINALIMAEFMFTVVTALKIHHVARAE